MRLLLPILALAFAAPAAAQPPEPEWRTAVEQGVVLRLYAYEPREIHLAAGRPVRLYVVNQSRAALDFSAGAFFRAAQLRPRDADIVRNGGFRLGPGERRAVDLVAPAGHYHARSSSLYRRLMGMSAQIIVE